MRKLLCLLLVCAMLLTACQSTQTETNLPSTEEVTEPLNEEEPKWTAYDGDAKNYVYYYDSGLNRMWEEDLLYVANTYLKKHALITPEESHVAYREGTAIRGYYTDEMYNPELRAEFLAVFNEIVPQIGEMTKTEFMFSIQRMLAVLGDAHAYMTLPWGSWFPCSVLAEDDALHVIAIAQEHKDLLYSQLVSINGYSIDEVIDAIKPFVPYENEYWLMRMLTAPFEYEYMFSLEVLLVSGIVAQGDRAEFEFMMQDGTTKTIEMSANRSECVYADAYSIDSPLFENTEENFWYKYIGDTPYWRISSFSNYEKIKSGEIQTLQTVGNALFAELRDNGGAEKVIIDLRGNGGGRESLGYNEVISILQRSNVGTIYVLIDSGSFSRAVMFATQLKQDLENVILVGSPAGQAPNFFGGVEEYTMPNTQTTFYLAEKWWLGWEDYEYDVLMPDVLIEQTLEDYKNYKDAVLQYVLSQP